jgi:glycosyltransferase involved in cell wall biosynthesis
MDKLKVLVTASTFPAGPHDSTPRFVLDMCRGIESVGKTTCLVLAPHSQGAKVRECLEGVSVHRFRYAYPERWELISGQGIYAKLKQNPRLVFLVPCFFLAQFLALVRIWVGWRPDVVLVNWIIPQGFIARVVKFFCRDMKMIMVCHGGDVALMNKNCLLRKLGEFILGGANRVVAVSPSLGEELADRFQLSQGKTTIIPCGIDVGKIRENRRFSPSRSDDFTLLFVGRLEEEKGVKYLLKAMALVVEQHPEAVLHLVGGGTLRADLMKLRRRLNLASSVVFHGAAQHGEVIQHMLNAAILLVPSIREGMPVVILEGMAAGLPIISTDAGGITDIIKPYETGILVPQRDENALAEKIIELMENKELRQRLADNAFNFVKTEFTLARTGEKYQEVIEAVSGK